MTEQVGVLQLVKEEDGRIGVRVYGLDGAEGPVYTLAQAQQDAARPAERTYMMFLWDNGQLCLWEPQDVLTPEAPFHEAVQYHSAFEPQSYI